MKNYTASSAAAAAQPNAQPIEWADKFGAPVYSTRQMQVYKNGTNLHIVDALTNNVTSTLRTDILLASGKDITSVLEIEEADIKANR